MEVSALLSWAAVLSSAVQVARTKRYQAISTKIAKYVFGVCNVTWTLSQQISGYYFLVILGWRDIAVADCCCFALEYISD